MQNHTERGAVLKSSFFNGKTALTEKAKGSTAEIHQGFLPQRAWRVGICQNMSCTVTKVECYQEKYCEKSVFYDRALRSVFLFFLNYFFT